MAVTNIITAGDYKGNVYFKSKRKGLYVIKKTFFTSDKVYINKDTVDHYEVVDAESKTSFTSGVTRGVIGAAAFGVVGAIAGASSAKKHGTHTVSVVFKDGSKFLCTLDDAMFKNLVEVLY